jgi:GrpB-like predicted nucleotidyltransferase (UPF0157 family)
MRQVRKNRSYELCEYTDEWPKTFKKLRSTLRSIYGDLALDIQHIGSTSIPGMLSKPTIDVLVLTDRMDKVKNLYPIFQKQGYVCWGDLVMSGEEYFTYDDTPGHRLYNVHTMSLGSEHAKSVITFRQYMRVHPDEAKLYMAIKIKLRDTYGTDDYIKYNDQKSVLMQKLKDRAHAWGNTKGLY